MEPNKMTPTPWKVIKFSSFPTNITGASRDNDICEMSNTHDKVVQNANAQAIVTAVNSTYGAGIDPQSIPALLETLNKIINVNYAWGISSQLEMVKEWAKAAIEKAKL